MILLADLLAEIARILRWRECAMRGRDPMPWMGAVPQLHVDWDDAGASMRYVLR